MSVGVINVGGGGSSTIEASSANSRCRERSSTVPASTINHAVSTSAASAVSVEDAVAANSISASRLVLFKSAIVGYTVVVAGARSARSSNHTVLSCVTVRVISTRSGIFTNSSDGVTNLVVSNIQGSAISIGSASAAMSVSETVGSTSASTVSGGESGSVANSGLRLAFSIGSTGHTTLGSLADRCNSVGSEAKSVVVCSFKVTR